MNILTADSILDQGIEESMKQAIDLAKSGNRDVYLTFDIDVADASSAPACGSPGGLNSFQLPKCVRLLSAAGIGGYDLVEVRPPADVADLTVKLAGAIVIEYLAGLTQHRLV